MTAHAYDVDAPSSLNALAFSATVHCLTGCLAAALVIVVHYSLPDLVAYLDITRTRGERDHLRARPDHGTSVAMIERHYGTLLDGAGAGIAGRLDALDAERDRATDDEAADATGV